MCQQVAMVTSYQVFPRRCQELPLLFVSFLLCSPREPKHYSLITRTLCFQLHPKQVILLISKETHRFLPSGKSKGSEGAASMSRAKAKTRVYTAESERSLRIQVALSRLVEVYKRCKEKKQQLELISPADQISCTGLFTMPPGSQQDGPTRFR